MFCDVIDLRPGSARQWSCRSGNIARESNQNLSPRRLIYVVDRRTVVDQATDVALKLQKCVGESGLAVSPLRGQLADNRQVVARPLAPAIIIGTVDLVGSALLFSGYRSSYKRRPLEAGMLGQDSLLVLDEAHLSKPFEKLVRAIERNGPFQQDREGQPHGMPMKVIRMSATTDGSTVDNVFRLDIDPNSPTYELKADPDPNTGEERNQIITRFTGKKYLTVKRATSRRKNSTRHCVRPVAIELAQDDSLNGKADRRLVRFARCRERDCTTDP